MVRPIGVPCTVVYESGFEAQLEALKPDYPRLEDMLRGAEWVIARTELRGGVSVELNPGQGRPFLTVVAEVEEERATLLEIGPA